MPSATSGIRARAIGGERDSLSPVDVPTSGRCDARFERVRQAFADNFAERGEVGAAVCVIIDGEPVVDLVGGWADEARTRPWTPDTIVDFYSAGKGLLALLALQLVDESLIGLDDPIATVWPEFGQGGKETATLRHALLHQAGVPAIREILSDDDLWDWDRMAGALAATEAWWEPGTRHTYHTNTFGHLVGETIQRVSGETVGERLCAVAEPLGADVHFGLTAAEQERCAEVIWAPPRAMGAPSFDGLEGDILMNALAHMNPPGYSSIGVVNTPEWRSACVPSTNGHGSATGLARIYSALVEPGRLLSPELLDEATHVRSTGFCSILGEELDWGLGFTPTTPRRPFGTNPDSFGHFGTGGSLGFGDPSARLGFGYVMNHVIPRWQSTRNRALIDALYACL